MKKFLCFTVLVMTVLTFTAGLCYCDSLELFHFAIGNVEKVSGGNSRIKYDPVDILKGMNMNKEEVAHNKFLYSQKSQQIVSPVPVVEAFEPQGSGSRKPAGKIPTAKTGLLNPKNPIDVTSYSDKVLFGFASSTEFQTWSSSVVRVIDSKGKVLATLKKDGESAEITLSQKPAKYYVELSRNDKGKSEYFYILLNMKASDIQPAYSARVATEESERERAQKKEFDEYMSVEQDYMKKRGLKNRGDLTEDDMTNIVDEYGKKKKAEAGDGTRIGFEAEMRALPPEMRAVLESYMKAHGISSIQDMTVRDWQALEPELKKVQNSSDTKNIKKNRK